MRSFLVLLVLVFTLTGCFQISSVQIISADATSITTTTIVMPSIGDEAVLCIDFEEGECPYAQSNPCEEAPADVQCSFDKSTNTAIYVLEEVLRSDVFMRESTLTRTRYTLTELSTGQEVDEITAELGDNTSAEMLQAMGFEVSHTVIMPAPIVSASVGQVNGNQVRIDLLSAPTDITIVAEEINYDVLIIVGSLFFTVIIVGVVVFVVSREKKQKSPLRTSSSSSHSIEESISKTEKKYREYILQHKDTFSREDIKKALISAGISDTLAERYLARYYKK